MYELLLILEVSTFAIVTKRMLQTWQIHIAQHMHVNQCWPLNDAYTVMKTYNHIEECL